MAEGAHNVRIQAGDAELAGCLSLPPAAVGAVVFAHGGGSGRHSPRNQYVAEVLASAQLATLLFDLLTPAEEAEERSGGHRRFDIELLAHRLTVARQWLRQLLHTRDLPVGYFGASTGAAAALVAAARAPGDVQAVVSRGGRPDLAGPAVLRRVRAPTLLIVGGLDRAVLQRNEAALLELETEKCIHVIPGATHLFSEPGALQQAASVATDWFARFLRARVGGGIQLPEHVS